MPLLRPTVLFAALLAMATTNILANEAQLQTPPPLHGLKPELRVQVVTASSLLCDDNTQRLPISRINDDYCDCRDGSDEPGTSACSHTAVQFHCVNAGYFSLDLPTSRVNDQLCDCCDGSDEYKRPSLCPNTCAELDAAYRREHAAQLALEAAGKNARVRLVQEAKQKKEQALRRRTDMEVQLEEAKRQVELAAATKASEEKLESEEKRQAASAIRLEVATALGLNHASPAQLLSIILDILSSKENTILKDSYLNDNDVEEETTSAAAAAAVVVPTFPLLKVISDAGVSISSALEADEAAFGTKELTDYKAEVKRINLINAERRRKTKLKDDEQKTAADGTKTITMNEGRNEEMPHLEQEEDLTPMALPTRPERPVKRLLDRLHVDDNPSFERPAAKTARSIFEDAQGLVRRLRTDLDALQTALDPNVTYYGHDDVFFALRETCVETRKDANLPYAYKMCYFGQASQDALSLGKMQPLEEPITHIHFKNGAKCWNGPERSFTVTLECSDVVELYAVEEPSTCFYTAKLKTPTVCGNVPVVHKKVDGAAATLNGQSTHEEL